MLGLSIGLLSAAALGYEVLLLRLFAEVWWQPFAATVISLALLGYGASGTVLALTQEYLLPRFGAVYRRGAVTFGLLAPLCYAGAQRLPLNPLDLAWSPAQWLWFAALCVLLAVPFLVVASCIGLALRAHGGRVAKLYAADLLGAGCGALGVVAVLYCLPPERTVLGVGVVACLASVCAGLGTPGAGPDRGLALAVAAVAWLVPVSWFAVHASPYKGVRQQLRWPGAAVVAQRLHPQARVQVVDPGTVPLRHAAGLSLNCVAGLPRQQAVFVDGEFVGALDVAAGLAGTGDYRDCLPVAAPYYLATPRTVAVLEAGTGTTVGLALGQGVSRVTAQEALLPLAQLLRQTHAGSITDGRLQLVTRLPRRFLARAEDRWDLIQLSSADRGGSAPPGFLSTAEDYLLTVEGLHAMLRCLHPGGMLALTGGFQLPPQASIKLFATAVAALRVAGVAAPAQCVVWFRTWNTATVLVQPQGFRAEQIVALSQFCRQRAFDLCYYPGIAAAEVNRFNVLARPHLFTAAKALLGPRAGDFLRQYPYLVTPAVDDRPFFHHFFRWRLLPHLWSARGRGGEGIVPWGYLVPVASLVQALVAGVALILWPLRSLRRGREVSPREAVAEPLGAVVPLYFGALGLGFMLVEIVVLKRLTLLLGHPVVAVAVTLALFLAFAGLGSRFLSTAHGGGALGPARTCFAVAAMICVEEVGWWLLAQPVTAVPALVRTACYGGAFAALAFAMGMPFASGLALLARRRPRLLPWAWGINGFASVWGVVAASLLALHAGFSTCLWVAAALYAAAGWAGGRGLQRV